MHLLCLGASHRSAPLELREKMTYSPTALGAALARFCCAEDGRPPDLDELVILSTCHRVELYAVVGDVDAENPEIVFEPLVEFLAETRGMARTAFEEGLYRVAGDPVALHLCRVAAGLDSVVLGEPQVLGQVAGALREAQAGAAAGPVLSALFQAAIRAGKRARTETAISRNPATVSSVAVQMAASALPRLADARVLVLGAGEMAELAVEALRLRGVTRITVVNRTLARATALAERWSADAATFERLPEVLAEADVVISSTDAPHFLVTADMAAACLSQRPERPLVFIDIAMPRDIDPAVAGLPGVRCYDLDNMHSGLSEALAGRHQEVPKVEAIAAEESAKFAAWLDGLNVARIIGQLRERAERIKVAEVEKTLRRMPQLDSAERAQVEALAEALVNKLLHEPTRRLRGEAHNGHNASMAEAARRLFGLDA
jgi:glutamyl-tRNA reductase